MHVSVRRHLGTTRARTVVALIVGATFTVPQHATAQRDTVLNVEPSEGLVDGQIVTVSVADAPESERLSLRACAYLDDRLSCADARSLRAAPSGDVSPFGLRVDAVLTTPLGRIDCRRRNAACVLALARGGAAADDEDTLLDLSPITFRADVTLDEAPMLTVTPATQLADGALLRVRGQGLDGGMRTNARLCRAGTSSPNACLPAGRPPVTSDTGNFYQEVTVYAGFGTLDGDWVDCTPSGSCELVVFGRAGTPAARAPLSFVAAPRPRPTLTLRESSPLADAQRVRVRGEGFDPGASISLQQYVVREDGREVWHDVLSNVFLTADAQGSFEQTVSVQAGGAGGDRDCHNARCVLAAAELQGRYATASTDLRFSAPVR